MLSMKYWGMGAVVAMLGCGAHGPDLPLGGTAAAGSAGDHPSALATTRVPPSTDSRGIGTAHPVMFVAGADTGSWIVACQARADTDVKPGIEVAVNMHGGLGGDAP